MLFFQLIPVALSLLVLGAHFLRAGNLVLLGAVVALLPLLGVRRPGAARTLQVALLLGSLEWVRTLAALASERAAAGQPATRLVLILGTVAAVTALSAFVFRTARARRWFGPAASGP